MAFKRNRESVEQAELDEQGRSGQGIAHVLATVEQSVEQLRGSELSSVRYREIIADDQRSQDEALREARNRRRQQRDERLPYAERWSWDDLKR